MTAELPEHLARIVRFLEERVAFNRLIKMRVESIRDGYCRVMMPWSDDLLGDPLRPAIHGGVLATLIDVAGGAACFTMLTSPNDRASTVDMRVDYLKPGPAGEYYCDATVLRMGNRVCALRMEVFSRATPEPTLVATGQAVYNVVRRDESK